MNTAEKGGGGAASGRLEGRVCSMLTPMPDGDLDVRVRVRVRVPSCSTGSWYALCLPHDLLQCSVGVRVRIRARIRPMQAVCLCQRPGGSALRYREGQG